MDLQENIKQTIRRLLKESEIPKHLLRRLDLKKIDEIFKNALTDASKKFAKNKDKWNFMDEYKFNKMVVSYMVDTFFSDEEYYNSELFTEMWDDLYNFFSEYYYDQIRDRYYAIEGESAVVCEDCGWFWYLSDGGDDPYVCHKCGNDNTPKKPRLYESDPKTGSGKKPKGSGRRLYTDENPKDTVSVKFRTKEDIVDTLNKDSFKSKPHKRQSQIINLIHQRVRAAYQNAKDPETKKRLKRAYDYIESVKEKSKEKTVRLRKQEQNESEITERCWAGYTQKGMKTMFGKRYPNCVKKTKK